MKKLQLQAIFLCVSFITATPVISQRQDIYYILDTTDAKNYNPIYNDYYNDTVIRSKLFYSIDQSKLHYEFIRINSQKYYCIEYSLEEKLKSEGIAIEDINPFDSLAIHTFTDNGDILNTKFFKSYKFIKDEFWKEDIDSNNTYRFGKYKNTVKDSIWQEIVNGNLEAQLFYSKGKFIQKEKTNLAKTSDKRIATLLARKWGMVTLSLTNIQKCIPQTSSDQFRNYIQFNPDGTYISHVQAGVEQNPINKGTWELFDNNKIKLITKGRNSIITIGYISDYSLDLIFE